MPLYLRSKTLIHNQLEQFPVVLHLLVLCIIHHIILTWHYNDCILLDFSSCNSSSIPSTSSSLAKIWRQRTSHHKRLPQAAADADQNHSRYEMYPEWLTLIMGFSFAAISIGMGLQWPDSGHLHLSVSLDVARLGLVSSLAAFVVSRYMAPDLGAQAGLLEYIGVFSGVTAFFRAVTAFSSLWLKLITWAIYTISVIAIIISWQLYLFKRIIR